MEALQIHVADNVAVALQDLPAGGSIKLGDHVLCLQEAIERGHKFALRQIAVGDDVIKYGYTIGQTKQEIDIGCWVHTHNMATKLTDAVSYTYAPLAKAVLPRRERTFQGYRRKSGAVGIRNEIWIIPTVSCVNRTVAMLEKIGQTICKAYPSLDGCFAFTHPYGCSQMGEDQQMTQRILADLVNHPNVGAVLIVGLGCENNNVAVFKEVLGEYDERRVKFLVAQTESDELAAGEVLLQELAVYAAAARREACSISELVIGFKCGGSDGLSGITANPLIGEFSDVLVGSGGTAVLTEVPEMFGAETILMNRAADRQVFAKTVDLINDFKAYFSSHHQTIYENPSPGNKKGGISTLEDKSLGCVQKGGHAPVVDVLSYGERVAKQGLQLLCGPGNDAVSTTVLAAAGCHLILFSTGRGTPWGTAVPTLKISTNTALWEHKPQWMDFNAGALLDGKTMGELNEELVSLVIEVASGKKVKAETMGFREIAIWKDGVTL